MAMGARIPLAAANVAAEIADLDERTDDGLLLTVEGRTTRALVAVDGATTWIHLDGTAWAVTELPALRRGAASTGRR